MLNCRRLHQRRAVGWRLLPGLLVAALCAFSPQDDQSAFSNVGSFKRASALCVDPQGYLYVLDAGRNEIVKESTLGAVTARVGGYGWSDVAFDSPTDIAAPNGLDVYVADYGNHRVQRFDHNLNFVSTLQDQPDDPSGVQFGYPRSVAVSSTGALFIVDGENNRVVKVGEGNTVERIFGDISSGEGRLIAPTRVRVGAGDVVYVEDGNRVVTFDQFGNFLRTIGQGLFRHLTQFAVSDDILYTLDSCSIVVLNEDGAVQQVMTTRIANALRDSCAVVDLALSHDTLYALTEQHVKMEQLPHEESIDK